MNEQETLARLDGTLYVYRDEDRNAVAVNRWRIGPRGGMTADTISQMAVPGKHVSQDEINEYATKFAAAEDMYEALEAYLFAEEIDDPAIRQSELAGARQAAHDALTKARGEPA